MWTIQALNRRPIGGLGALPAVVNVKAAKRRAVRRPGQAGLEQRIKEVARPGVLRLSACSRDAPTRRLVDQSKEHRPIYRELGLKLAKNADARRRLSFGLAAGRRHD
jgi:hypothetical protein